MNKWITAFNFLKEDYYENKVADKFADEIIKIFNKEKLPKCAKCKKVIIKDSPVFCPNCVLRYKDNKKK